MLEGSLDTVDVTHICFNLNSQYHICRPYFFVAYGTGNKTLPIQEAEPSFDWVIQPASFKHVQGIQCANQRKHHELSSDSVPAIDHP